MHYEIGSPVRSFEALGEGARLATIVAGIASVMLLFILSIRRDGVGLSIAGIQIVVILAALTYRHWERSMRAELGTDGFASEGWGGRHEFPWSEVEAVFALPHFQRRVNRAGWHDTPRSWRFDVVRRDGQRVRLAGLRSIESLGAAIDAALAARIEDCLRAISAGERVAFGPALELDRSGLHGAKASIAWTELEDFSIDPAGELRLRARGVPDELRLTASHVANLGLLERVLTRMVKQG